MKKIILLLLLLFVVIVNLNVSAEDLPNNNVTFEFNEVPVSYALNAICKAHNIDIVFGTDSSKIISLDLNKVKLSKAINMILLNTNLSYYYSDNILIIDTEDNLNKKYKNSLVTVPGNTSLLINDSKSEKSSLIINQDIPDPEPVDPGYSISKGINQGTLIPGRLEVGLISSSKELPALVRVTKDISYEGDILIPKGSLFYGYGVTDFGARKIFVKLNKLILGEREIDVTAHLVKGNGESGFCSEYRDLEMEKFWPTFLMNFAGMLGEGFKDKYYIEDDQGNKQPVESDSLKNELIDSSQEGINAWSNQLMSDAKEHNAIITVDSGIKVFIFIDKKINIDKFKNNK